MIWNEYISSITKPAVKNTDSLCRARNYLFPKGILYLYKST